VYVQRLNKNILWVTKDRLYMLGEKGTNKERGKSYNEVFCVGLEFKASV
jgi:hypothetical protein